MSEQPEPTAFEQLMEQYGYSNEHPLPRFAVFPTGEIVVVLQEMNAQIKALQGEVARLKGEAQ